MSESQLIDAVKTGELAKVEELLNSGSDIHQPDEQGWTPLNWAAGRGDLDMVKLLLDRGADVFRVGRDQRTPYKISLAARHTDVARLLKEKEQGSNGTSSDSSPRDYAKGYLLGDLRKFSGWHEAKIVPAKEDGNSHELSDSDVVFLHQDFTVTQLIWPGENVIFNQDTPEFRDFCSQQLQFKVLDDFDLIASTQQASSANAT
jgi:ankyrin repeat protein